ncbi:MAG: signal peptidase II [Planctomycetaceae bacterium]|nr:signal peptidase II [Planctomycetota bacterium]NUN52824.1 signal peptidase II [Planctomycetaceae bacterium]
MTDKPSHLPALAAGAIAAILDLATKSWAYGAIPYGEVRPVLGEWFALTARSNPAGPWSLFHGVLPEPVLRISLPLLSVAAVVLLVQFLRRSDASDRVLGLGLAFILGGAAGNLWDRSLTAAGMMDPPGVRDFILVRGVWFGGDFPAFNLADAWITVGVVFVGWRILFERKGAEPAEGAGAAAGEAGA